MSHCYMFRPLEGGQRTLALLLLHVTVDGDRVVAHLHEPILHLREKRRGEMRSRPRHIAKRYRLYLIDIYHICRIYHMSYMHM